MEQFKHGVEICFKSGPQHLELHTSSKFEKNVDWSFHTHIWKAKRYKQKINSKKRFKNIYLKGGMGGFLKHKTCDLFSLQLSQDQDRSGDFFILFLCVFIYFYLFFVGGVGVGGGGGYFIVPCGKFRSPYLGKAQQLQKSSASHSCQCVQCFPVSKQWYGCQCWGFLTCKWFKTVAVHTFLRESALEVDCAGKKNPLPYRGLEPASVLCLAVQSNALPTELPLLLFVLGF